MRRFLPRAPATALSFFAAFVFAACLSGCPSPRDIPLPVVPDDAGPTPAVTRDGPGGPSDAEPVPGEREACPDGQLSCPGLGCVDTRSPEHCGRSCTPCPTIAGGTATCDGSRCGIACPMGMQPCLDRCIDGAAICDDVCPGTQRPCNGVCVDLGNLAACGPACMPCPTSPSGKATCNGTSCELECSAGFHKCEGDTCRPDRDPDSCGSSCTPCPAPEGGEATCDGTVCGTRCPSGTTLCAGACIPIGQPCMGVCPDGKHDCGGNCVPNDTNFCGPACKQCRPPANAEARCNGSDCGFTCRGGFRECGGQCLANDRPCNGSCPDGSKVCGDRCVPTATCCSEGREGCPRCFSCGNGTCNRQADGTGCGGDQVCRTGACVACGGFGQACCASNRCTGAGLSCQGGTCRGECTPGDRECRQQTPRLCNGTGQWQDGSPCNGQACVGGACVGSCAPGKRGCGGNETPQVCNNSGQLVAMGAPCKGVCRGEGQCVGVCRRGQQQCAGSTQVQTCDGEGAFSSPQPCVNQTCTGDCCQGNCAPNQRRCSSNGLAVEACQNGQFRASQECPGVCRNEACFGNCRGSGAQCTGGGGGRQVCENNVLREEGCPAAPEGGTPRCTGNGQCTFDCPSPLRKCGGGCCFDITGIWTDEPAGFNNSICAVHGAGNTVDFDYFAGDALTNDFQGTFSAPRTMESRFGQGTILSATEIQWPAGRWRKLPGRCP